MVSVDGKVGTMIPAGEIHGDERKRTADDVSKSSVDVETEGGIHSRDKSGDHLCLGQTTSGTKAA